MAKAASTIEDDSVIITPAEDGQSFTVSDNPNYVPEPLKVPEYYSESMSKNDVIATGILAAVVATVIGGISWFAYKDDQKRQEESRLRMAEAKKKREETDAWFEAQRLSGHVVIETADRTYMSIPADAYAKSEVRKRNA